MNRRVARALGLASGLLLAAGPARAGTPIVEPLRRPAADTLAASGWPSPEEAQRRSAMSTLVPFGVGTGAFALDVGAIGSGYVALGGYVLATGGLVFGPAAGYDYAGLKQRGAFGTAARFGLVVGVPVAVALSRPGRWSDEDELAGTAYALLAGMGLAAGVAVWDIATVGGEVRRHNAARAAGSAVRLGPALLPFSRSAAVALSARFGPGGE